jgi:hypothetical protein
MSVFFSFLFFGWVPNFCALQFIGGSLKAFASHRHLPRRRGVDDQLHRAKGDFDADDPIQHAGHFTSAISNWMSAMEFPGEILPQASCWKSMIVCQASRYFSRSYCCHYGEDGF